MKRKVQPTKPEAAFYLLEHISDHSIIVKTTRHCGWKIDDDDLKSIVAAMAREKGVRVVKVLETKPNYHCLVEYLK
jgi:hypothetical protein